MTQASTLPRTVRGKRPQFFDTPGVDEAISMIISLAQEVAVLRERLDSAERVAARHNIPLAAEIESLEPDANLLAEREAWRQAFYDRLFFVFQQQRAEFDQRFTADRYAQVIADIAEGKQPDPS